MYIVTYDDWSPCQIWSDLEGESVAFIEDSYDLGAAPRASFFLKICVIWPLHVDLEQQLGHFGQNSIDLHRKHLSHILMTLLVEYRDLRLSFAVALHTTCSEFGSPIYSSLYNRPVSELLESYPSTRVRLSLSSFLHNQSPVGILTEILPTGCFSGPAKGLSSASEEDVSTSGMCVQPMKDLMPLIISL